MILLFERKGWKGVKLEAGLYSFVNDALRMIGL